MIPADTHPTDAHPTDTAPARDSGQGGGEDPGARPALSLCIPTYNRASYLADTLERIAAQLAGLAGTSVEVVVSDNASSDDTPGVLDRAQAAYPRLALRRSRQTENLGPDINILETVRMARGEFVYLLSDDDMLLPGAVDKLLDLMRDYPEADALTLNIRSFVDDTDDSAPPWYDVPEDTLITDRDRALEALALSHLFMSMTAFRRQLVTKDYREQIGSRLTPSFMFMDVLARGRGLVITARPFLAQRLDNTGGYGFFEIMVTRYQDLLRYGAEAGLSPAVLRGFHVKQLKTSIFHFLIRHKMMAERYSFQIPFWDGCWRLLRAYGPHPFVLFLVLPLMLAPAPLLRRLWRLYRVVRYGPRRAAAMAGVQGARL